MQKRSGRFFHLIPTTCFAPRAFQEKAYLKAVTRVLAEICGSTRPLDNSNQYQKVDCDGMPREEAQGWERQWAGAEGEHVPLRYHS